MTGISAQISLYPLGLAQTGDMAAAIGEVWEALRSQGLPCQVGDMSTVTYGDDAALFAALRQAFMRAAERGPAVMVVTLSNACPLPSVSTEVNQDA